ncbi:MAG: pyridine nucleotide-disulfide oxidoreductase [Alteromonadaceae bacterium]|uniref:NAD(P)/FAD-dependent oxidoreductase n=1 Tax=Paraglaciecola chathamensis TaxID=368405 RepID=UPI000C49326A|nr:FAD/NAD(P)-binding oxidoreductase [Paraglaciecola agarilytica]MBN24707.1 pyridine nucleotide-disulfide oxidoreductase [Alteromonadaceae bacterium]|tara:strand:+ start:4578 stop:5810 length:1233 start_codon:yes stop_codon:yes gene_type:complete
MSYTADKVCIVVGASHAGAQLADSVRKNGWEGKILVVGNEAFLPYHRPPLSKDFLAGNKSVENILLKSSSAYEKLNVEFKLSTWVTKIDPQNKTLLLDDGSTLIYDKLALALGARVRKVPIPGSEKAGVYYLRTIEDIENIRPYTIAGKNAVIVGGGYIGLETAAALRKLGMEVTVIEMMPRILQRVTAQEISDFYSRIHKEEGVTIVTDSAVNEIEGAETVTGVRCSDGGTFPADLVIIGAGILPNVELAAEAGLKVEQGGIVVDEFATTSNADIFAAGDCTWHFNPIYKRWMRLESVQNAVGQARVAGATICEQKLSYNELPWFWSDQYDLKLQIAGLSQGFDNIVIRGDISKSRQFAAFYFAGDQFIAVDAVNMPAAFMVGKRLLLTDKPVDKAKLADESVELKSLL